MNPETIDDHILAVANYLDRFTKEEIIQGYKDQSSIDDNLIMHMVAAGELLYKWRKSENSI